jgi:hypothetical protein
MIVLLRVSELQAFNSAQTFLGQQNLSPEWSEAKKHADTYSLGDQDKLQKSFKEGYKAGKKAMDAFQKVCI